MATLSRRHRLQLVVIKLGFHVREHFLPENLIKPVQPVERKGGSNYYAKQREQGIIESFTEVCDEKIAQNLRGKFLKAESHRKQQIHSDQTKFWGLVDQLFNYLPSPVILNHHSAQMKSEHAFLTPWVSISATKSHHVPSFESQLSS